MRQIIIDALGIACDMAVSSPDKFRELIPALRTDIEVLAGVAQSCGIRTSYAQWHGVTVPDAETLAKQLAALLHAVVCGRWNCVAWHLKKTIKIAARCGLLKEAKYAD